MSDIIKLNVGGTLFTTTRETLCKFKNSVLERMFSPDQSMLPCTTIDGAYFIDRDPTLFAEILSMCRDGKIPTKIENSRLRKEVKFWFPDAFLKTREEMLCKHIVNNIQKITHEEFNFDVTHTTISIPQITPLNKEKALELIELEENGCKITRYRIVNEWTRIVSARYTHGFDGFEGYDLECYCILLAATEEQRRMIELEFDKVDNEEDKEHKEVIKTILELLASDKELIERTISIWNKIAEISSVWSFDCYKELICRKLAKKLGSNYNLFYYSRFHECIKGELHGKDIYKEITFQNDYDQPNELKACFPRSLIDHPQIQQKYSKSDYFNLICHNHCHCPYPKNNFTVSRNYLCIYLQSHFNWSNRNLLSVTQKMNATILEKMVESKDFLERIVFSSEQISQYSLINISETLSTISTKIDDIVSPNLKEQIEEISDVIDTTNHKLSELHSALGYMAETVEQDSKLRKKRKIDE